MCQNQNKNISTNDIYKKYTKHFQDPARDLLDPIVEFVRWCPYFDRKKTESLEL